MRTKALAVGSLELILRALTDPNRLVCLVALQTGLRVSDVLAIRTKQLYQSRFTIYEKKTGKKKQVRLPQLLKKQLLQQAGEVYVFPHRLDPYKHRTRQAVWKDINRAARFFSRNKKMKGVGTHSMRKSYAVDLRRRGFTTKQIQRAMNHSDPTITAIYALADELDF